MTIKKIKEKYYQDISDEAFDLIVKADPTSLSAQRIGKYSKWLLKLYQTMPKYLQEVFIKEDLYKATTYITALSNYKHLLPVKQRNIFNYKNLTDLYDAVNPFLTADAPITHGDEIKAIKQGAEKVYEDERWTVIIPRTWEASQLYGAHTQWCTASNSSPNYFNRYSGEGPLFINIDKQTNQKYQFHFESQSFMDERDYSISKPVFATINATEGLIQFYHNYVGEAKVLFLQYEILNKFEKLIIIADKDNQQGIITADGKMIIEPKYQNLSVVGDYIQYRIMDKQNSTKLGLFDINGKKITDAIFDEIKPFCNGLAVVSIKGKYGFIDTTGEIVIPCRYSACSSYTDDIIWVSLDDKFGYIDNTGQHIIPIKYGKAINLGNNVYAGVDDATESYDLYSLFDAKGKKRENPFIGNFKNALHAPIVIKDRIFLQVDYVKNHAVYRRLLDRDGNEVLSSEYETILGFNNGLLARVKRNGKWGLMNSSLEEVTPCKYDFTGEFINGFAAIRNGQYYGFVDETGKIVIPCKYTFYTDFNEDGMATVVKPDGSIVYIKKDGTEIIEKVAV